MNPDKWGQQVEEGTYTISGGVNFYEGQTPKDNAGNDHTTHYEGGSVYDPTPISITVLEPIYINDGSDITEMQRHLVDYRNEITLYVSVPPENDEPMDKFKIYLPYPFTTLIVNQYSEASGKYDVSIDMVLISGETSKYMRFTRNQYDTIIGTAKYEIKLKK